MDRRLPEDNGSASQILEGSHLSEHALEVYSLNQMESEEDIATVEEHLLVCAHCETRLDKFDQFHLAAKAGAEAVSKSPEQQKPTNFLPIAIAAGAAAILLLPPAMERFSSPAAVDLVAVRNQSSVAVPTGKRLELNLDLTGLPGNPLSWELLSPAGKSIAKADLNPASPRVEVPGLESGQYWVRVQNRQNAEVLREFSLLVR